MKHIYLCGPVTGEKREEALRHFKTVGEKITRTAVGPIWISNPMVFCSGELDWVKAMRTCACELPRCDGIALLQGWQRSKGAALELKLAQDLHIPVIYVEQPVDYLGLNELFTAAPETLRFYNSRLTKFHNDGLEESLAENRAVLALTNRYLDPHGYEYIEISREE